MPRFLPLALSALPFAAGADEAAKLVTVRVFAPDGKPAVGAKVWVYRSRPARLSITHNLVVQL